MENKSSDTANIGKQRLLSVDVDKITKSFIEDMFAAYHDKETNTFKQANFNATDTIILTKDEYQYVKGESVKTTLGELLLNRYVFERTGIIDKIGYWTTSIDSKGLSKMDVAVNALLIDDKITTETLGNYIDSRDRLGFWSAAFTSVSISPGLVKPMENVNKRKQELFKEYADELHSDNPVVQILASNKIEKELMAMVRDNLKDDTGYDMYRSGDGNLDNNYKTINVMRGAVYNNASKKYDVVENSLMNGVTKYDIPAFANSVVAGAYPSAVGTAEAGYSAKMILALLQSEHIDPDPNSDCGTESTIPLTITNSNKAYVLYRYIKNGKNKTLTTLDNIDSFVGKTVDLYSPQCCKHDAICAKCAGQVYHKLGITNVGLVATIITQSLLNFKLKSKHDLSQTAYIIPEDYLFLDKNNYCYITDGLLKNKVAMKFFIPKILENEKVTGFVKEATTVSCMGIFGVKFYDDNGNVIFSTMMTVPAMLEFNVYEDIQEDADNYIVSYEPESSVCYVHMTQSVSNVDQFLNQTYLLSKVPQIPYNIMTNMMFRCLEINKKDLKGPSITYELLARRVCRSGETTFAKAYGANPNIDQMSYKKNDIGKLCKSQVFYKQCCLRI